MCLLDVPPFFRNKVGTSRKLFCKYSIYLYLLLSIGSRSFHGGGFIGFCFFGVFTGFHTQSISYSKSISNLSTDLIGGDRGYRNARLQQQLFRTSALGFTAFGRTLACGTAVDGTRSATITHTLLATYCFRPPLGTVRVDLTYHDHVHGRVTWIVLQF